MTLNEISIELTQRCPNRCIHCSSMSCPEATMELATDVVMQAIEDAKALGAHTLCLSGGEPLLHPDFISIVNYANKLGLDIYVYSSGIIFDDNKPVSIPLDTLMAIKDKIQKLIINIEAATPNLYDCIMGTDFGGFHLMLQTIEDAVRLGITVEAHMVPMNINIDQIRDVIELCQQWGVSRVSFLRLVLHGRALENQDKTSLDVIDELTVKHEIALIRDSKENAIRIGIPFRRCSERVNCLTGTVKLNIRYDGNVYPCEAFKNDIPSGLTKTRPDNIYRTRLMAIYTDSAYLSEIRQMLTEYQSIDTCETCMNQYYQKLYNHEIYR